MDNISDYNLLQKKVTSGPLSSRSRSRWEQLDADDDVPTFQRLTEVYLHNIRFRETLALPCLRSFRSSHRLACDEWAITIIMANHAAGEEKIVSSEQYFCP